MAVFRTVNLKSAKTQAVKPIPWFKSKVSARAFTRISLLVAALWFLGLYPVLNWHCPSVLPPRMAPLPHESPVDFVQYYAGALVAKTGMWDCLYPTLRHEVYSRPSGFVPVFKTFLFDEKNKDKRPCYYPIFSDPGSADYSPNLVAHCPLLKNPSYRFMNPPPLAVLLRPLAYVDFETAAHRVWPTISIFALFGLAFFSSHIHRLLRGRDSYTEGLIVAAVVFFSFGRGMTHVSSGNVTPILACLIAFAGYAWMRDWQIGVGLAMIPLLLFKAIGLAWCPLLLARRVQWKTLLTLALLTVALNATVLHFAGTEVYRKFFFEVLPKVNIPVGIGFVPGILHYFGFFPSGAYLFINLSVVGLLCLGYWKSNKVEAPMARYAAIAATLAGTMALYCLINFSIWLPYFPNYLFFPFLGWILWECGQVRGLWRTRLVGGTLFAFVVVACDGIIKGALFLLLGRGAMDVYHQFVVLPCFTFVFPVFFLGVALRRLFFAAPQVMGELQNAADVLSEDKFV